jgi:hypothetical protein
MQKFLQSALRQAQDDNTWAQNENLNVHANFTIA